MDEKTISGNVSSDNKLSVHSNTIISAGTIWVFEKSFEAKAILKINFFWTFTFQSRSHIVLNVVFYKICI